MTILGSMAIAFSMYSKIPVPQVSWTKERMQYAMCFFPFIGAVIGLTLYIFCRGAKAFGLVSVKNLMGALLPVLITGGIHMDGFLDVTDAKASYGDREQKLEILKDPHVGAFAVIGCVTYSLIYLGFFQELPAECLPLFCVSFILTRALSGLSVVTFPKAKKSGLAAMFSNQAQKRVVTATMAGYILFAIAFLCIKGGILYGGICLATALLVFFYYHQMAIKQFGGITGDLAGYFLQLCELALLAALTITGKINGL